MGQINAMLKITNLIDQSNAEDGLIKPEQIRSLEISMLVDTGATHLCLPSEAIAQLGLKPIREVLLETAAGPQRTLAYAGSFISLMGREATFDCVALPNSKRALLGVFPMEALGIEPDLRNQSLRLLPMDENQSYMTIY